MRPTRIVLARRDSGATANLARSVQNQFLSVETVSSSDEIRNAIVRVKARLAIVDLELVNFSQLEELCREFPATAFVSTHRLADDAMWSQSLALGAVDCCLAAEVPKIVQSSERYVAIKDGKTSSAA
jgi:hypothetical protein